MTAFGEIISQPYFSRKALRIVGLKADPQDIVIDDNLILLWGEQQRLTTGADLLGFLLRGGSTDCLMMPVFVDRSTRVG